MQILKLCIIFSHLDLVYFYHCSFAHQQKNLQNKLHQINTMGTIVVYKNKHNCDYFYKNFIFPFTFWKLIATNISIYNPKSESSYVLFLVLYIIYVNALLAKSINSIFRILLNFNFKAHNWLLTVYIQNKFL